MQTPLAHQAVRVERLTLDERTAEWVCLVNVAAISAGAANADLEGHQSATQGLH